MLYKGYPTVQGAACLGETFINTNIARHHVSPRQPSALQVYLAHKKTPPPYEPRITLGIGLR